MGEFDFNNPFNERKRIANNILKSYSESSIENNFEKGGRGSGRKKSRVDFLIELVKNGDTTALQKLQDVYEQNEYIIRSTLSQEGTHTKNTFELSKENSKIKEFFKNKK